MENNTRPCLDCGKEVRGRIDKKYCNDYCRNNYNNRQNSDQNNYVRNVNNILRKNRRLLADFLGAEEETAKVRKDKMITKGYQFQYHTHTLVNQKQQTYFFCYEYGFLPLEQEWVLIVRSKK